MVAHELQCLLCKLPMVCSKGKMVDLQDHLRKDHEVVRYEVDMLLHLCLASRAEREELTRLLSPRMDWFAERGEIENDINVFESLASREELTLNETEFHSFTVCATTGEQPASTVSKSTQTNVEQTMMVGDGESEVEEIGSAVKKGEEVKTTDENMGDLPKEVNGADEEEAEVETIEREGVELAGVQVPQVVDEASAENLTLVLSEDDSGGDAGDAVGGGEEQEQPMAQQSDVTLREETDKSDPSSDDVMTSHQDEMVASTPMVTVKKETVLEVTGSANKFLFEVTATEEEGPSTTSARLVDGEGDQTEVGEIKQGGEEGLELSRLSGTHIEEVGDASDESWLLAGTDTGEMSSEEPGRVSVAGVTLARRLRMRSVNKYNSWLTATGLNKECVGEVDPEMVEDALLTPRLRTRSVSKDEQSGLLTGVEPVGQEASIISVEGATLARRLRVRSVNEDNSWEVVEGATTRCSVRLRKVSAGNMNQTFLKDGAEDSNAPNQEKSVEKTNQGKNVEETNQGKSVEETNHGKSVKTNQGKSAEEQEELNTTYSLADVTVTRSGCKRKREEEKEGGKRRSPRMRKPLLG